MRSTFFVVLLKLLGLAALVGWRRWRGRRRREREPRRAARAATGRPPGWRMELMAELLRSERSFAGDEEPAEARRQERPAPLTPGLRRQVELADGTVGGVPGLWVTPNGWRRGQPTILYLHGGGYCSCSPATHRGLVAGIALASGARAFAADYRLAPENRHPAAVEDALAAYRALLDDGVAPQELFVAGDSAGGGLSLATMTAARAAGVALPRAAILLSPWVDLTLAGESIDRNAATDFLSRQSLRFFAGHYLGDGDPRTPSASPLHADLTGLPPLLIQLGGAEVLLSEGRELAERATAAGVDVTLRIWDGAIHVFQAFSPFVPEAGEAIADVGRFVRALG